MTCPDSSLANPNATIFAHVPQIGFNRTRLEGLIYQFWKPKVIEAERERVHQTWFDYRQLHPALRSYVFVEEYNRAHQRAYKRFYGAPLPGRSDLPYNASKDLYRRSAHSIERTLRAMHLVDELGCPYDSYFDAAFTHFMQERGFDTYWKDAVKAFEDLPLPPIIVMADARSMINAQQLFERKNAIRIRVPKHPTYRASAWRGTPNQIECAKWLIDQASAGTDRNYTLARMLYDLDLLREQEVVRRLGIDVVKLVRAIER
ncbi:MAG: hypothetical protein LPK02_07570 [Rhodobacterales bacterium]|nr:hypothetical protein [Rhodobacterales bacterium]